MNAYKLSKLLNTNKRALNCIKSNNKILFSRNTGDFESERNPINKQSDEHVDLTPDDYVNDILNEEYYHFFNQDSDPISSMTEFDEQRTWYHWYINPEHMLEKYNFDIPVIKWLYFTYPMLIIMYFIYILPNKMRKIHGKKYPLSRYVKF